MVVIQKICYTLLENDYKPRVLELMNDFIKNAFRRIIII